VDRRLVVSRPEKFLPGLLDGKDTVVHLHGSVDDPAGMIMTMQEYLNHYRNDRRLADAENENRVLTFLEDLFQHKNVLFIGYGLEELEILEYVILKARANAELKPGATPRSPRHFMLQGFFSYQHELVISLEGYYRECGIELIPFQLDERNWRQLIEVVEHFAGQIQARPPLLLAQHQHMEALLDG